MSFKRYVLRLSQYGILDLLLGDRVGERCRQSKRTSVVFHHAVQQQVLLNGPCANGFGNHKPFEVDRSNDRSRSDKYRFYLTGFRKLFVFSKLDFCKTILVPIYNRNHNLPQKVWPPATSTRPNSSRANARW